MQPGHGAGADAGNAGLRERGDREAAAAAGTAQRAAGMAGKPQGNGNKHAGTYGKPGRTDSTEGPEDRGNKKPLTLQRQQLKEEIERSEYI